MLSANAILEIPDDAPQRLYRGDAAEIVRQYRALAMRWHPDRPENQGSTIAGEVFRKIAALKTAAETLIDAGEWFAEAGQIELLADDGRRHVLRYRAHQANEIGHVLLDDAAVAYLFRAACTDLFENALAAIDGIRFADAKMEAEFDTQLPRVKQVFRTTEYRVIVLEKDPEAIRLTDLLRHQGGKLPAAHMAWLMGRCLNLACWLGWTRRQHGDIGGDSLFVNPRLHSIALLGGWQYSVPVGAPLIALPRRTAGLLPSDVLRARVSDVRGDLELIRALGRELLGDAAGSRLHFDAGVPAALAAWTLQAGGPTAVHDFENWPHTLREAFGPRRFVELPVTFDQVYSPLPPF